MAEVAAAAVRVEGLVAVEGGAAVDGVAPGLATRDVAALLRGDDLGGQEEVVAHEEVDLVGRDAGELVDLLGGDLRGPVLVVDQARLNGGGAGAQDLDGGVGHAHGQGPLGGHDHQGRRAVALLLEAGHAQVLGDLGVVHGLEVLVGGLKAIGGRVLLDRGLVPSQRVCHGAAAQALGEAVQGVVDLVGVDVVLHGVLVDPVVKGHAEGAVERASVGAVVDLVQGRDHDGEREVLADVGRLVLHRKRGGQVAGAGEHDVVGAGGHCHDGLLKRHVASAAGLGVVDGALGAHADPVGHLHVGGDAVSHQVGVGAAVVEEVHVAGLQASVGDGLQGGVAKRLALADALGLGVGLEVLERRAAHADDGHASSVLAKLDHGSHPYPLAVPRVGPAFWHGCYEDEPQPRRTAARPAFPPAGQSNVTCPIPQVDGVISPGREASAGNRSPWHWGRC